MADKKEYDPTKPFGRLLPQSKTTLKQRLDKSEAYFKLDPKVRSKLRKEKYDALSDTQKNTLSGVKTAAEVASYFLPGGALRLAVPIVRGIQAVKTGFKVGKNTYKTLKEATAAKNKLKQTVNTRSTSKDKGGRNIKIIDTKQTTAATKKLKAATTRKLTAQQKALKAKQDKTTNILKGSSNISLAAASAAAAEKFRNKKTIIKNKKNTDTPVTKAVTPVTKTVTPVTKTVDNKSNEKFVNKIKKSLNTVTPSKNQSVKNMKTINKGDTLSQIARKNGTSVKKIMDLNPEIKDANKIYAGRKINVGGKSKNTVTPVKGGRGNITKKKGGTVYRRGGGKALRGMGKATYSNKPY